MFQQGSLEKEERRKGGREGRREREKEKRGGVVVELWQGAMRRGVR